MDTSTLGDMMTHHQDVLGSVVSLFRYPVKSMMGEELNATYVSGQGVLGDRYFAVVDGATGKAGSAKNPRNWPNLFDYRAAFTRAPVVGEAMPPVGVTLPDGKLTGSDRSDVHQVLSKALGREVRLDSRERLQAERVLQAEEYWPDVEELDHRNTVTDFDLPNGSFFDCAVLHLLTTATLERLHDAYPQGRFEVRRFRPNIVIAPAGGKRDVMENRWIGRTLSLGDEVRLEITAACGRCVMTTLPQADLPSDLGILRTAANINKAEVGVYASVLQNGTIRRGDTVRLEP